MCALLGIDSSMSRSTHDYIMLEAIVRTRHELRSSMGSPRMLLVALASHKVRRNRWEDPERVGAWRSPYCWCFPKLRQRGCVYQWQPSQSGNFLQALFVPIEEAGWKTMGWWGADHCWPFYQELMVILPWFVARFLTEQETMESLGFSEYCFEGLTTAQSAALVGRSMSASSLCFVLIPLLKQLHFLRERSEG